MRPGWNPTRRNRHAGTGAHGHGADNRLCIPESRCVSGLPRLFYERLSTYVAVEREVGGRLLPFFVEPPHQGFFYPCTVDDMCFLLSHLPTDELFSFDFVVMRQPTRKQRILSPVWGRAAFFFEISENRSGAAIVIEAMSTEPIIWPVSL